VDGALTAGGVGFDTHKGESGAQFRKTFLPPLVAEPHALVDLLFGNPRRFNPSPRQIEDKLKYTRRAASQNDPRAQFTLGVYYSTPDSPQRDLSVAAKWFQEAADQGFPVAEYAFAMCLGNGDGIPQNIPEMERYLKSAADHGHLEAQFLLGSRLRHSGDAQLDRERRELAMDYLKLASDCGHVLAEFVYGICFEDGGGESGGQDLLRAALHYKRSGEGGCCYGLEAFGECLEFGLGVSVDFSGAADYYRRSAESGFFLGEVNYGLCLEFGKGTEVDRRKALELYQRACNESPRAMLRLHPSPAESAVSRVKSAEVEPPEFPKPVAAGKGWSGSSLEPRQYAGPILAGPFPMAPEADSGWPLGQTRAAWAGSMPLGGQPEALDLAGRGTPRGPANCRSTRDL
jgi:TPR repeat protein